MKSAQFFLKTLVLLVVSVSCSDVKFRGAERKVTTQNRTYTWYEGGYVTACSKPCGGGTQTQVVECRRDDGVAVDDSFCTGTKPTSVRSCNIQACESTYTWNVGPWGTQCSKTCGGGEVSRTVTCQDQNGTVVADSFCSASPKPATTQACNTDPCPSFTYDWYVIAGTCSVQCGGGTQTDQVYCRRSDNGIVADSFCNSSTKPPTTKSCNTNPCPQEYTYAWTTGAWGTCSKDCGGGLQTRSVQCRRNDGEYVAETYCNAATKPATQQSCNTQSCPTTRNVTTTATVTPALNSVDVIMIIDDSSSMAADQAKLAARMAGFLSDLDALNIDYQVCLTTTDTSYYKGSPIKWVGLGGSYIINKSTPNKSKIFTDTINALGAEWSSDERGIYALNLMVANYQGTGCFRPQATLSTILISDEDERSVGGDASLSSAQYKPLEPGDMPSNLISKVDTTWSTATFKKPFIWNSIIVKPGDKVCEASQDAQGTPSFQGKIYAQLSSSTYGHIGSICDTDYSQNLKYIRDRVVNSMPGLKLECTPVGTPTITFSPPFTTSITITGDQVKFSPALTEGVTVTVKYVCPN